MKRFRACRLFAIGLLVVVLCSCKSIQWKRFLPRDTPRLAIARFQGALIHGYYKDAYNSLSRKTRESISYTRFWAECKLGTQKIPDTDYKLMDVMRNCTVSLPEPVPTDDPDCVYMLVRYKRWGTGICIVREGGEWKIGLYETVISVIGQETVSAPVPGRVE